MLLPGFLNTIYLNPPLVNALMVGLYHINTPMCFGYEKFTFLNHFLIFFTKCDSDNLGHNIIGTFEFSGFLGKMLKVLLLFSPFSPKSMLGM